MTRPSNRFALPNGQGAWLAAVGCAVALAACTDLREVDPVDLDALSDPEVNTTFVTLNACGGYAQLALDGQILSPGDPCGPCGAGVVSCAGTESLVCLDDPGTNDCGGCATLPGRPGRLCGDCNQGTWECSDDGDTLVCAGDRDVNACGGCAVLAALPGADCGTELEPASFECGGPDELRCVSAESNVCGGFAVLDDVPGSLCGTCGLGTLACDGPDTLRCADRDRGVNACGGCDTLPASPGDACGTCGGTWTCDDDGGLTCSRVANACGGCSELAGVPGQACTSEGVDGMWACDTVGVVRCVDPGRNLCGGTAALDETPGAPCGECLDGAVRCLSPDRTACVGGSDRNVCGGCAVLPAEPGQRCAGNATWVCTDGGLACSLDLDLNLCGGTAELPADPGARCGLCDTGRLACAGANQLRCEGATPAEELTWYVDADGDGYGAEGSEPVVLCAEQEGYARETGDCNDDDDRFFPGADEDPCVDTEDLNCDGVQEYRDDDNDGVSACLDCDDRRRDVRPGAPERCDGRDNDCNGEIDEDAGQTWYADADGDGVGDAAVTLVGCTPPEGYVDEPGDCDDADPERYPGNPEVCDGVDNDCDGEPDDDVVDGRPFYRDADGDGFGSPLGLPVVACEAPEGYVADDTDCRDDDPSIRPDADEVCDGRDNNCDALTDVDAIDGVPLFVDADRDGFGDPASEVMGCLGPGFVVDGTDCDDSRRDTYPGARELFADGIDQNCDAREICYLDNDGDGFTADFTVTVETTSLTCAGPVACPPGVSPAMGMTQCQLAVGLSPVTDCNDSNPAVYPGAGEIFGDGVDQDCDGAEVCWRDDDEDGWRPDALAVQISLDGDCDDPGEALDDEPVGDCWDAPVTAAFSLSGPGATGTWDVRPRDVHPHWAPGHPRFGENADDLVGGRVGVDYDCSGAASCYIDTDGDDWRSRDEVRSVASVRASDGELRAYDVCGNEPDTRHRFERVEDERCDLPLDPSGLDYADIRPDAVEVALDGIDTNCDGLEICYVDEDGDGWGRAAHEPASSIDGTYARVRESGTVQGLCTGARTVSWQTFETRDANRPEDATFVSAVSGGSVTTRQGDCADFGTVTWSGGNAPANAINPGVADPINLGTQALDSNCDGRDGQWTNAADDRFDVYVSNASAPTCERAGESLGSCSIQGAIDLCGGGNCNGVMLETGDYSAGSFLRLVNGVDVYGGFRTGQSWLLRTLSVESTSSTSRTSLRLTHGNEPGVFGASITSYTVLHGLRIESAQNASGDDGRNGRASILMGIYQGSGVALGEIYLVAGNGSVASQAATTAARGADGGNASGTTGGSSWCGARGGRGGELASLGNFSCSAAICLDTSASASGATYREAQPGDNAPAIDSSCISTCLSQGFGSPACLACLGGQPGGDNGIDVEACVACIAGCPAAQSNGGGGQNGNVDGANGLGGSSPTFSQRTGARGFGNLPNGFFVETWQPVPADSGDWGDYGRAGGGGGLGESCYVCCCGSGSRHRGGSGGGGGAGGCGGYGGLGGGMGGASIGLLVSSATVTNLGNVTIQRGNGGAGGRGQSGGAGGSGGDGAGGGSGPDCAGNGGRGGDGADGGDGGGGAGGSGGPSIGVAQISGTVTGPVGVTGGSGGSAGTPGGGTNAGAAGVVGSVYNTWTF